MTDRNPARRLRVAIAVLGLLIIAGTAGYALTEDLSAVDALYLTVVTITTVGYGDLVPHTVAGRLLTVVLVLWGVGNFFYIVSAGAELALDGRLRDIFGRNSMERRTAQLTDHVIVCGYGRFGRVVVDELRGNDADVVVVDTDPALEETLRTRGVPYVIGSALEDDVLERAGIRAARAIVVATPSDPDNVFITLSAREKSAAIRIHARGETEAGLRRLELAGADQALSAYHSGGVRMAASILRPSVVDFLELSLPGHRGDMALEEMRLPAGCTLIGRTVVAIEGEFARLRVVALERGDEALRIVPDPDTVLAANDLLIVIGDRGRLAQLAQAATAGAAR